MLEYFNQTKTLSIYELNKITAEIVRATITKWLEYQPFFIHIHSIKIETTTLFQFNKFKFTTIRRILLKTDIGDYDLSFILYKFVYTNIISDCYGISENRKNKNFSVNFDSVINLGFENNYSQKWRFYLKWKNKKSKQNNLFSKLKRKLNNIFVEMGY